MKVKKFLFKMVASKIVKKIERDKKNAIQDQQKIFNNLIKKGSKTLFGIDHNFNNIHSHKEYVKNVSISDYEQYKPYIQKIIDGKKNVIWEGRPFYFAKTSGTTSGIKYIPLTKKSIQNQVKTARNTLFNHCYHKKDFSVFEGKLIFLSGSPKLLKKGKINMGRLSGIVNHHIPKMLKKNQLPTYKTNCIDDWEEKLDKIIEETTTNRMTLISGIPPWMVMYFERVLEKTEKKTIKEIFPHLKTIIHGGVNFQPYSKYIQELVGGKVDYIETYPASEGFIAFEDSKREEGLLLNTNAGIFYEFIPLEDFLLSNYNRITLGQVKKGIDYVVLLTSNAGLWCYNVGDTIKFVSTDPYRIKVTGRIEHFISAFGEHVISNEVEKAVCLAATKTGAKVKEFTVAPYVAEKKEKSYHEWFVEFSKKPNDFNAFQKIIDSSLCDQNIYYKDLIQNHILDCLKVRIVERNGFLKAMKNMGKCDPQNKPPRLKNNRSFVDYVMPYISEKKNILEKKINV